MSTEETDITVQTAHNVAGRNVNIKEGGVRFKGKMTGGTIIGHDQHITYGLTKEEVAALVIELKRVDQPKVWDGRIPYIGLSAFQESDAQFFFGRESLVDDLLERVQKSPFITIAGPSGSGKSSVARAGLFHALRSGRLPKSDTWLLATMTPGGNPIEQLATAVVRAAKTPGAGDHIRQQGLENGLALHEQIDALLSDDPRQRFFLLVDQFEETFTQTKEEAARVAFINLLTVAAQIPGSRAIILLALRSDFVSHCARYPNLRALMSRQFQLVGAMEAHDLAKAITLPALEVGAEIDPALVSQIMADMKGEPGALPLMSFALRDLFEAEKTQKGKPMDLTLSEYKDRGGIEKALERHANQVFANFSQEQQELAKTVFSRLIEIGEDRRDTRRTAVFTELIPAGKDAAAVTAVVDTLAREGARLLTTSGGRNDETDTSTEATVTIAHEKLIDAWPWLRQLVDDNRDAIALQNQIANDAQAWAQAKDAGYLYRGGRLLQVEERLTKLGPSLDELSQQFIQASLEAKETEQQAEAERIQKEEALRQQQATAHRFRRFTQGLSVAVIVAVIATILALSLFRVANQERGVAQAAAIDESQARGEAEAARAMAEAESTRALLAEVDALQQATEADIARSTAVVAQATSQANAALAATREVEARIAETDAAEARDIAEQQRQIMSLIAQSQSIINTGDLNNESMSLARLMAVVAKQIDEETTGGQNRVLTTPWNYFLTHNSSASYQPLVTVEGSISVWSPDNHYLASVIDGDVVIWETHNWQELVTLPGNASSLSWNYDASRLAVASREIVIWNTETWQPLTVIPTAHMDTISTLSWDTNGDYLVSGACKERENLWLRCIEGEMIVWDISTWEPRITLTDHVDEVRSIDWNHDSSLLASASCSGGYHEGPLGWLCTGGEIIIWDTVNWLPIANLLDNSDDVLSIAWNVDSTSLASSSCSKRGAGGYFCVEGEIIIWDTSMWQPQTILTGFEGFSNRVNWDENGRRLASAFENGIMIWDSSNWQILAHLTEHGTVVNNVNWNNGSTRLASSSNRSTIIWDTDEGSSSRITLPVQGSHVAWSPDGRRLASSNYYALENATTTVWNAIDWQPLQTTIPASSCLSWRPNGQYLATSASGESIHIWETTSWQLITALPKDGIACAIWNSEGSRLISASWDEITVWDTHSWQPIHSILVKDGNEGISSLSFSPDGRLFASANYFGRVSIWDAINYQPITEFDVGFIDDVTTIALNFDGGLLAVASEGGEIEIWSVEEEQRIALLQAAWGLTWVNSVQWMGDGSYLIADADNVIKIWDTDSWQPLTVFSDNKNQINDIAWNDSTNRYAITSGGEIIIVDFDLVAQNCKLAGRNFSWQEWIDIWEHEPYRIVCPQWPVHPSVPPEALSEAES